MSTLHFSTAVKRQKSEDDHSLPSSSQLKNVWSDTFTPQYTYMVLCSVTAQGQIYLLIVPCLLPSSGEVKECVELYLYSPNTPHGVVLS